MRILLDTHVLLWWMQDERLSDECRDAISDPMNDVVVSVVTGWELSIKSAKGKISVHADLWSTIVENGFDILPIQWSHALTAGLLPPLHSDPFDRMLVAQSQVEGLVLATRDRALLQYDVVPLMA